MLEKEAQSLVVARHALAEFSQALRDRQCPAAVSGEFAPQRTSPSGEDGTLARTRRSSACRSTLTFFRIERNWVRSVAVEAPDSAAMAPSGLPDMSCIASRDSAKDSPK